MLSKLNKVIELKENSQPILTSEHFIHEMKPFLRKRFPNSFSKIIFDKTDNGNGMIFIKFSKIPWHEKVTNEELDTKAKISFIINIDGLDTKGNTDDNGCYEVNTLRFNNENKKVKKLKSKEFYTLTDAKNYVKKYFNYYSEEFLEEDVGGGTASGATGFADGGVERTVGNIAVKPTYISSFKRSSKIKRKKRNN